MRKELGEHRKVGEHRKRPGNAVPVDVKLRQTLRGVDPCPDCAAQRVVGDLQELDIVAVVEDGHVASQRIVVEQERN